MTKFHIAYRNAKGQMKSADPFNCPTDAPEAVRIAAAAVVEAFTYGPPIPTMLDVVAAGSMTVAQTMGDVACSGMVAGIADAVADVVGNAIGNAIGDAKPKGKRGRPAGYKCSKETVDRMVAGRVATMAQKRAERQIKNSEIHLWDV